MTKACLPLLLSLSLLACNSDSDNTVSNDTIPGLTELKSGESRDLAPAVSTEDLNLLVANQNDFAFELFRELSASDNNLFISPYSAQVALAQVWAGARSTTENDMATALNFSNFNQATLHPLFNQQDLLLTENNNVNNFTLNLANTLFGQKDFSFQQPFLDILAIDYGAGVQGVDFINDTENARLSINTWIERQTREKIQNMFPQGIITQDTRFVLVNAVYFKGEWALQFPPGATANGDFTNIEGVIQNTDKMQQTGIFAYHTNSIRTAVEMLYSNQDFSMLLVMPSDFGNYELQFSNTTYQNLLGSLIPTNIELSMPKWNISGPLIDLNTALTNLGMGIAFSDAADFSGIAEQTLVIQKVAQKTFIAVDENGTEAAAATGVVGGVTSAPPPPLPADINKPFFYMIIHKPTNTILFLGKYTSVPA